MSKLYIEREVVEQALADLHELITQNEVSMISLDVYSHAMANARKSRGKLRAALSAAAEPVKVEQHVAVPQGWKPTEEQFQSWLERYFVHPTDRDAFFDAASLYLTASPSPAPAVPDAAKPVDLVDCGECATQGCEAGHCRKYPKTANPETQGERAGYVRWLSEAYPDVYTRSEAERWWENEHVSVLAWKARALLSAGPARVEPLTEEKNILTLFESWWGESGQFCRAGGGDYEKTFAWNAWLRAFFIAFHGIGKDQAS